MLRAERPSLKQESCGQRYKDSAWTYDGKNWDWVTGWFHIVFLNSTSVFLYILWCASLPIKNILCNVLYSCIWTVKKYNVATANKSINITKRSTQGQAASWNVAIYQDFMILSNHNLKLTWLPELDQPRFAGKLYEESVSMRRRPSLPMFYDCFILFAFPWGTLTRGHRLSSTAQCLLSQSFRCISMRLRPFDAAWWFSLLKVWKTPVNSL